MLLLLEPPYLAHRGRKRRRSPVQKSACAFGWDQDTAGLDTPDRISEHTRTLLPLKHRCEKQDVNMLLDAHHSAVIRHEVRPQVLLLTAQPCPTSCFSNHITVDDLLKGYFRCTNR
jgi:hypothetical protein